MEYRQLGRSGLTVSLVGLGCNNFGGAPVHAAQGNVYGLLDLERTRAVVDAAFDCGVTFYDTADVYGQGGSESYLGEIFATRRHEVIIATKWGSGLEHRPELAWGSRRYIRQALEASLRRLRTDYVDLYQMHWPDSRTPIEETIATLDELVREGKIRYSGHSHFTAWQVADADWTARSRGFERFVSAQNHYSLLTRGAEAELLPACERFGVGLLPYFPLESGLLTGKYRRGASPAGARLAGRPIEAGTFDLLERLEKYATERGRTLLDVAIGALAVKPVVSSVITGATQASQIRTNVATLSWKPGIDDLARLGVLLRPESVSG